MDPMSGTDIVIVSAARTAVGSFNGSFADQSAHKLGATAIKAALDRARIAGGEVDEVIFGHVLTAGAGQNTARQAAMAAGIPDSATALVINQVCGSGLRTVAMGMQAIANGDASIIVAGGQESMSMSPHSAHMRAGTKMGDVKFVGCLPRLSHGQHGRKRGRQVADHTRGAGCVRRGVAEQG
jgi:acetyl-CoA C-acetyltransferase